MMAKKPATTIETEQKALVAIEGAEALDMLFEETKFNQMQRAANMFAASELVPDHFRGKPANVMVALQLANALRVQPLLLMMKIYPVHGRFGFESQLMISLANSRGPFRGTIRYRMEGEGDSRKCTAYAYHKDDGEICEARCSIQIAKDEGWYDRKDKSGKFCSKWRTMPDLMLQYRAAAFLVRTHCPEVLMGMKTADELEDINQPALQVTATVSEIQDRMAAANKAEQSKAKAADAPLDVAPDEAPDEAPDAPVAVSGIPDDVFANMGLSASNRPDANRAWLLAMGDDTAPDWDSRKFLEEHARLLGEAKSPLKGLDALVAILEGEAGEK